MNNPIQDSFGRIFNELSNIFAFVKRVVFKITHLADDTDVDGTIKDIKGGVVLEGSNLWVLICSAAIACIGLDTNSPAVIIGAMLISPLMSPILGIGLSMGINDKEYLIKSFYNFCMATGLSLLTAFIYFKLTPLGNFTHELESRTQPTILDAGVALFGGLAGIIAGSRTEKSNAIPGVAIATALMPPVCTAGFGLANGNFEIFGGAFYLFFINALLISLSTYAIVRMLRFPLAEDEDPEWAPRIKGFVAISIIILLIPSITFLLKTLDTIRQDQVMETFFVKYVHDDKDDLTKAEFKVRNDSTVNIKLKYFGLGLKPDSIAKLQDSLNVILAESRIGYKGKLILYPTDEPTEEETFDAKFSYESLREDLDFHGNFLNTQQSLIDSLFSQLEEVDSDTIPFNDIQTELKALYPDLEKLAIGTIDQTAFDSIGRQEALTAILKWDKKVYSVREKNRRAERIGEYLKVKLDKNAIEVVTR